MHMWETKCQLQRDFEMSSPKHDEAQLLQAWLFSLSGSEPTSLATCHLQSISTGELPVDKLRSEELCWHHLNQLPISETTYFIKGQACLFSRMCLLTTFSAIAKSIST